MCCSSKTKCFKVGVTCDVSFIGCVQGLYEACMYYKTKYISSASGCGAY